MFPQRTSKKDAPTVVLLSTNTATPTVPPVAFDHLLPYLVDYNVFVIDIVTHGGDVEHLVRTLAGLRPDVVLVTFRNVDTAVYGRPFYLGPGVRTIAKVRRRLPHAVFIGGGVAFSLYPERVLAEAGLDLGVVGDGEGVVKDLLGRLFSSRADFCGLPGVVFRDHDRIVKNPPVFRPISDFLPPVRLANLYRWYLAAGVDFGGGVETKRGCDRHCIYCVEPYVRGHTVRCKEPALVVEEVRQFLSIGVHRFMFLDSEFNNPESHAIEVLDRIAREGLGDKIEWQAYARPGPRAFSEEFVTLARRTGCVRLDVDAISVDEAQVRRMAGGFHLQDTIRAAHLCRKHGVPLYLNYLLGGPGDSVASCDRTIEYLESLQPASVTGTLGVRVYPHTPLERLVRRRGLSSRSPFLKGFLRNNDDLFRPVFYVEPCLRRFLKRSETGHRASGQPLGPVRSS